MDGGVQRGHAVDARRIDVDLLSDECAYRREVAACRRVNERRRRLGRIRQCLHQPREDASRAEAPAPGESQKHQRILMRSLPGRDRRTDAALR
jgi:hypothetical protein